AGVGARPESLAREVQSGGHLRHRQGRHEEGARDPHETQEGASRGPGARQPHGRHREAGPGARRRVSSSPGDLFEDERPAAEEDVSPDAPLAERMRPRDLSEVEGLADLVGPGSFLANALAADKVPTLLFVDEIHRFNRAQQDAFLPFVEAGDIVLVGATTENPSFELNGALLSRLRVVILPALRGEDLVRVMKRALADTARGLAARVTVDEDAFEWMSRFADGDARRALTALEAAVSHIPFEENPSSVS